MQQFNRAHDGDHYAGARRIVGKRPDYRIAAGKLTEYLLILLQRKLMDNDVSAEPASLLSGIKEYIENNYEKNITLSSLSDVFFVSPFHIAHLFKEK